MKTTETELPTYMTINEAAHNSGISRHLIRDLVKANKIKHIMSGAKYLINYPKMMQYFEALEETVA